MKRLVTGLVVLLLIVGCSKGLSKKEVEKYRTTGLDYLEQEKCQEAVDNLSKIVSYDDDDYTIAIALAKAYSGLADFRNAIRVLEETGAKSMPAIRELLIIYQGSLYLRDFADVDWQKLAYLDCDWIDTLNERYIKYKVGELYGLLDNDYNIVLEPTYYEIIMGFGPFDGQIMVYKDAKAAAMKEIDKTIILDDKLNETKKKGYGFGYNESGPEGYFIDVGNDNQLMKMEWEGNAKSGYIAKPTPIYAIDKEMVVPAAERDALNDDEYSVVEGQYLVLKDLRIIALQGTVQNLIGGIESDRPIIDSMITVEKDGKCAYYNLQGINVSGFQYDIYNDASFKRCNTYSGQQVVVKRDGRYGLLNKFGQIAIPIEFDGLSAVRNGEFLVLYQGRLGVAIVK